jgi:ParB/RepB/Spo0J family partition protein
MKVKEYSREMPVSEVRQSPHHFRKESAQEKLDDLANSIKELGLIHAVSVVEDPSGAMELINGHRRWLAHRRAKLKTIRANVYEYEPHELKDEAARRQAVAQFLLAANSAEPLIPVERARYYEEAMDKFGWEPSDLARVHHKTEDEILDDLLFLNLESEVLDLVQAHPDSFSQDHLRVLAEHASPSMKKAWAMTPGEQVDVARALADQRDKKIVQSPRALETHIKAIVKERRDQARKNNRKLGRGDEDPVKALYKLLDGVQKSVTELSKSDLTPLREIDPRDKGKASEMLFNMAQELIDFAEGPLQKLRTRQPAAEKSESTAA